LSTLTENKLQKKYPETTRGNYTMAI